MNQKIKSPAKPVPRSRPKRNLTLSARLDACSTATVVRALTDLGTSLTSRSDAIAVAIDLLATILCQRLGTEPITDDIEALETLERLNLLKRRNVVLSRVDWSDGARGDTGVVEQIKRELGVGSSDA